MKIDELRKALLEGLVIPAHPLALNRERQLDEARQRGLTKYYAEAGAGGIAVGVHTTQFAIRERGLLEPVLRMAREEWPREGRIAVAGVCGSGAGARREAEVAARLGYDAILVSLAGLATASVAEMVEHMRGLAGILPVVGFYLQPAVGGRVLPLAFWRELLTIENLVAIKVAPFHRYQTIDVVRALAESGRVGEVALYTGNDDNIINDLLTVYEIGGVRLRFVGGLLGQWAVWTRKAGEILREIRALHLSGLPVPARLLTWNAQLTEANAALFDAANGFAGCIAGIHEVLRREGKMEGIWCLDPAEGLSPGQAEEIDRVLRLYPHLQD